MLSLDHLDSVQFEELCYDILTAHSFVNLNWRKGTGLKSSPSDFGRDIECQIERKDVDGKIYLEHWFVECKHYNRGVPAKELSSALAWAESENVDTLLIIVSNFLSNPAKEYIEKYQSERKPRFRIKVWEKPDLERLVAGKSLLLRKYNLVGEFPYLAIIHPAHALYMKRPPINTLDYMFSVLDKVDPETRDHILSWISFLLIERPIIGYASDTIFGQTITVPEYDHNLITYEEFKKECYKLAQRLDEPLLVFLIINWVLQSQLSIGDITAIDEFVERQHENLEFMKGEFREKHVFTERDRDGLNRLQARLQESMDNAHTNIRGQYERYVRFCEKVVAPLLLEKFHLESQPNKKEIQKKNKEG